MEGEKGYEKEMVGTIFVCQYAGTASMSYENEELSVNITGVGKEEHGVQIYYDGFTLESGCEYEIQFDASSTVERTIQYRSQINGGDYHAYNGEYLVLTPETQHFDIKFTMEEGSNPAPRLCMNMGYIEGNDPGEHTIVFDNFDFQCIDESGRIKPEAAVETPDIQINQIGYRPDDVKQAAAYLDKNDNQPFTNPEEIVTGEYPDNFDADERFWSYAELFKATGDPAYETAASDIDLEKVKYGLGWADVGYYATYAYLTSDYTNASFAKNVMTKMDDGAAQIVKNIGKDTYGCSIFKDYVWGSNILAADNGMMLSLYAEVSGKDYSTETKAQLDYLLGNNGNSYCFLTGYGTLSPEGTHHRPSQVLGTTLKGMLVGGPNAGLEDPYAAAVLKGKPQALCYVDNSQSYSCNEITVYWNSPLIYLLAEAK